MPLLGNLLLLAPLAAVVALGTSGGRRRRLLLATGAAALGSLVVESGQWWIEDRQVSPWDVLLNTGGGLAAAFAAVRLGPRVQGLASLAVGFVLFVPLMAYMSLGARLASDGQRLAGWDPHHRILAGNEAGGGRAFAGHIGFAELCAGPEERTVCAGSGATMGRRAELVRAAERSQRLRLRATVLSRTDAQRGPARILTFSEGTASRNVTLGLDRRDLVLRVRTSVSGENGTLGQVLLSDAVPPGEEVRVSATYDRGLVRLSAETAGQRRTGTYYPGILQGWQVAGVALAGHSQLSRFEPARRWSQRQVQREIPLQTAGWLVVFAASLFVLPVCWVVALLVSRRQRLALVLAPVVSVALIWLLDALLAVPTPPRQLVLALPAAVLGTVLGLRDRAWWRLARPAAASSATDGHDRAATRPDHGAVEGRTPSGGARAGRSPAPAADATGHRDTR